MRDFWDNFNSPALAEIPIWEERPRRSSRTTLKRTRSDDADLSVYRLPARAVCIGY